MWTKEVRILVCGSRHFDDWMLLCSELGKLPVSVIIEGEAKGADFLSRVWAKYMNLPFEAYPADWKKYGIAAGPIRNKQMLDEGKPDLVLAFMYPDSRGTKNMVEQATKAGIETKVIHCV